MKAERRPDTPMKPPPPCVMMGRAKKWSNYEPCYNCYKTIKPDTWLSTGSPICPFYYCSVPCMRLSLKQQNAHAASLDDDDGTLYSDNDGGPIDDDYSPMQPILPRDLLLAHNAVLILTSDTLANDVQNLVIFE